MYDRYTLQLLSIFFSNNGFNWRNSEKVCLLNQWLKLYNDQVQQEHKLQDYVNFRNSEYIFPYHFNSL